jgi:hypothetical protein
MGAYRDTFLLDKTLELKDKYKLNLFIETGTNDADSIRILSPYFSEIFSCEVVKDTFAVAQRNTIDCKNIFLYNETSPLFMERICQIFENRKDLIFFLDAHWDDYWPLLDELVVIHKYKMKCPIIIHDFYVPDENGNAKFAFDKYKGSNLDLKYVKNHIDKIFNNEYDVYYPTEITGNPCGWAIFTPKTYDNI